MTEKNWIAFDFVKSILFGLLFPLFFLWISVFDPKFINPIIEGYKSSLNYIDLWVLFRTRILFPLFYFLFFFAFTLKIIKDALRKYKINIVQLQSNLIVYQSEFMKSEKPKTTQERLNQIPQSEKAKMMFLIKKNQKNQPKNLPTKE